MDVDRYYNNKYNPSRETRAFNHYINNATITDNSLEEIIQNKYSQYSIALNESINRSVFKLITDTIQKKYRNIDDTIKIYIRESINEMFDQGVQQLDATMRSEKIANLERSIHKMMNEPSKSSSRSRKTSSKGGKRKSMKHGLIQSLRKSLRGNRKR